MNTFSFYSFRIFKISPYINFKKFLGRILAPPSGRRPGADAPPPAPPRYATVFLNEERNVSLASSELVRTVIYLCLCIGTSILQNTTTGW